MKSNGWPRSGGAFCLSVRHKAGGSDQARAVWSGGRHMKLCVRTRMLTKHKANPMKTKALFVPVRVSI